MIDTHERADRGTVAAQPSWATIPTVIKAAYWMVVLGTAAALASNVLELRDVSREGASIAYTSDLVLTIIFIAMFAVFAEMMRRGRQWGRVLLTVFAALGLLFNTLGLLGLGGRPIETTSQVVLALIGNVASVAGIAFMFSPTANRFFDGVRHEARTVSNTTRKWMLTVHIAVAVGWLGLVDAMLVLAITGAVSDDRSMQESVYTAMYLLDAVFLGLTSLLAWITGVIGAAGTKWHLMRRYWVATKFLTTTGLMFFGFAVIHPRIAEAHRLIRAGADPDAVHQVGIPLAIAIGTAAVTLIAMTAISTNKPWGFTRYGRRMAQTSGPARPTVTRTQAHTPGSPNGNGYGTPNGEHRPDSVRERHRRIPSVSSHEPRRAMSAEVVTAGAEPPSNGRVDVS